MLTQVALQKQFQESSDSKGKVPLNKADGKIVKRQSVSTDIVFDNLSKNNDILLIGQSHDHDYSLEILKENLETMKNNGVKHLAIEILWREENALNDYINDKITKEELKSDFKYWRSQAWTNDQMIELADEAKKQGMTIHGVDYSIFKNGSWTTQLPSGNGYVDRDKYMGEKINEIAKDNPREKIAFFGGMYHALKKKNQQTTLADYLDKDLTVGTISFQNKESIFEPVIPSTSTLLKLSEESIEAVFTNKLPFKEKNLSNDAEWSQSINEQVKISDYDALVLAPNHKPDANPAYKELVEFVETKSTLGFSPQEQVEIYAYKAALNFGDPELMEFLNDKLENGLTNQELQEFERKKSATSRSNLEDRVKINLNHNSASVYESDGRFGEFRKTDFEYNSINTKITKKDGFQK